MTEFAKSWTTAALAMSLILSLGGRAWAQQPPPPVVAGSAGYLGARGQIAISGDMKFNILHESYSGNNGDGFTTYEVQPALDYFVSPNVSVGGLIDIRKDADSSLDSRTTFGIGARAGYNLVLGSAVSLWVRGGLRYEHITLSFAGQPDRSGYAIPLTIYAPLLWHPISHFFLGAGLFLDTDLVAKSGGASAPKTTDVGISSTLGGYFGGL